MKIHPETLLLAVGPRGTHPCLSRSSCPLSLLLPQVFEDDAIAWEERLNRINAIFDVWIDVQRRWVYLEGIFTGSADIKHLLPNETQRFQRYNITFCLSLDGGRLCVRRFNLIPYVLHDCVHTWSQLTSVTVA